MSATELIASQYANAAKNKAAWGKLVYNFLDNGGKGDGDSDDSPALNKFFDSVPDGAEVVFPQGDYVFNSPIAANKPIKLVGFGKVRFIVGNKAMTEMLKIGDKANEGSLVALSADVGKGAEYITVSSVTGINVGDYILLQSDERITPVESPSDWRKGEILRVRGVSAGRIDFYSRTYDSYLQGSNGGYKKINMVQGVSIENIEFYNPYPNQTFCMFLQILNAVGVTVDNVKMTGGDMAGLTLWNVIRGNVSNVRCEDFVNNDVDNRYGYAISVERASQQLNISNCHAARCRHSFTTNGGNANPYRSGVMRDINVVNCTSADGSQAQFDTHPIGEYITFENCSVQGARFQADPYGSSYANTWGFQIRSSKTRLVNCQVYGTDLGILLDIYASDIEIINPTIYNVQDVGIMHYNGSQAGRGNVKRVVIKGGNIIKCGNNAIIVSDSCSDVTIMGVFIDGVGKVNAGKNAIDVAGNAGKVRVLNNTIIDSDGPGGMAAGVNLSKNSFDCIASNNVIRDYSGSRVATPTNTAWAASTAYLAGDVVATSGRLYTCTVAGTSSTVAPTHTSGTATDGSVTWQYRGKEAIHLLDIDEMGITYLPHNLVGGRTIPQFDVGTENGKPLRLNRNSNGSVQFMMGGSSAQAEVKNGGHLQLQGYMSPGLIDASAAVNGSVFIDAADSLLKYKNASGVVKTVTLT